MVFWRPITIVRSFLLFVLFSSFVFKGHAEVTLFGSAPTYANTELVFKKITDPFTSEEMVVGTALVHADGTFTLKLPVEETMLVFAYLGIYKGYMYVEPDKEYEITFPERKDKSQAEKLNPFFEPVGFQIAFFGLTDRDVNFKIQAFDNAYLPYLEKFTQRIYSNNKKSLFDSAVYTLSSLQLPGDDLFFRNYQSYKLGYLKHLTYQQKTKSLSKEFFQASEVLYNNPAYCELFNQIYARYFYYIGRSALGKVIYANINTEKSFSKLENTLMLDSVLLRDTLRELVIIKNIHDEFYSSNFSRAGLLCILDTLIEKSRIAKNKEIAKSVRKKITRLMVGFPPPSFELLDSKGKVFTLNDFKGSYVYLNFCVCSSYSCIKEFDVLQKMTLKYKEKLVIITIADDDSLSSMSDFVNKSGYSWLFLHTGNQPEVLQSFDIRAYPTYFLIGPDGNFIYSPAISPAEGFEMKLFNVMRARNDI